MALAEAIGAVIDPAGPLLDGASGLAFQARGASTATLGDVRDRAEVVVVWRADPVTTHPRLLERLRLPDASRELVVVDERRTATAAAGRHVHRASGGPRRRGAVDAARARPRARRSRAEPPLDDLAARLRGSRYAAILHHVRGHVEALGLHALVRDLCRVTHAVAVTLRHEGNAAGAEDVLAWQTGYPSAVSFAGGHPRSNPGELSAAAVLERGDADAALVVGSDPLEHLPPPAAERLRAIPVVSVDALDTATADAARVAFTTAAPGVHRPGVVHRLDGVPVPLRALLESSRPSDEEVLAGDRRRRRGRDLTLRIAGGRVYDPANGVAGEVRDVCLSDGKVVEDVPAHAPRIDARGMVVMPGGVDIHAHIAGPKVNAARRLTPEEHRGGPRRADRDHALGHRRHGAVDVRHRLPLRAARLHDGGRGGDAAARRAPRPRRAARHADDRRRSSSCCWATTWRCST